MEIEKGSYAKVRVDGKERMWFKVEFVDVDWFLGTLDSHPIVVDMEYGKTYKLNIDDVIDVIS